MTTETLRFTRDHSSMVHHLADEKGRHFELHERLAEAASTYTLFSVDGFARRPVTIRGQFIWGAGMKADEAIAYASEFADEIEPRKVRLAVDAVRDYIRLHEEYMRGKKTLVYRGSFFFVRPDGRFDFGTRPLERLEDVIEAIEKALGPC